METRPEHGEVAEGERRDGRRMDTRTKVELVVETHSLTGLTQNLSPAGVFLFSEAPLRVRVELEQDGEMVTRTGRLVRVERMSEVSTGFAIEFDAA